MIRKNEQGFTLIEMLVVIAVVGILSATVLTALNPSRNRAKDARIITGMQQLRAIAETKYNGTTGKYESLGFASSSTQRADIVANGGTSFGFDTPNQGGTYRVWVKLNSGKYYCIDGSGNAGEQVSVPSSGGTTCK